METTIAKKIAEEMDKELGTPSVSRMAIHFDDDGSLNDMYTDDPNYIVAVFLAQAEESCASDIADFGVNEMDDMESVSIRAWNDLEDHMKCLSILQKALTVVSNVAVRAT